jgi:hemin uptake protein HemP
MNWKQANMSASSGTSEPGNADEVRPGRSGVRAREVDVRQLLDGAREIRIRHRDEVYTLRLTRLDKLILTK